MGVEGAPPLPKPAPVLITLAWVAASKALTRQVGVHYSGSILG